MLFYHMQSRLSVIKRHVFHKTLLLVCEFFHLFRQNGSNQNQLKKYEAAFQTGSAREK